MNLRFLLGRVWRQTGRLEVDLLKRSTRTKSWAISEGEDSENYFRVVNFDGLDNFIG